MRVVVANSRLWICANRPSTRTNQKTLKATRKWKSWNKDLKSQLGIELGTSRTEGRPLTNCAALPAWCSSPESLFFSSPRASLTSLSRAGREEKRNPGNQPRPQGFSLRKWEGPWKSPSDEVAWEFDGFTLFHRHNLLFCFFSSAVERLKACDDAFRKQLEQERQANEQQIQTLSSEKQQEIDQANARVR